MDSDVMKAMIAEARQEAAVKVKVARALGRLPDDYTRRKVLRAAAVLLDCPQVIGDRANR